MSVTRIYRLQATEHKGDELHQFLQSLKADIAGFPGCCAVIVYRSIEHTDEFTVVEEWDSVESHTRSGALFPKEKMQSAMPLFAGPPTGGFFRQ